MGNVPTCGRSARVGGWARLDKRNSILQGGWTSQIRSYFHSPGERTAKYDRISVLLIKGWQILKPNSCSHIKTEIFTAEKRFFATRCCKFAHTDITVARIVYITN